MKRRVIINIGDTDENADWIKTAKTRKREKEIYARLKREYEEEQGKTE